MTPRAGLLLTALLPPVAAAQQIAPLVVEGDAVPGVGLVENVHQVAVADDGTWFAQVDTDAHYLSDYVILKDGRLLMREGDAVSAPLGAVIEGFDTLVPNADGDVAWILFLTMGVTPTAGVYFNDHLLILKGQSSFALGLSAGTTYTTFYEAKVNDNDQILLLAEVDDPAIPGAQDDVLMLLEVDANGDLLSETVLVKEGDVLPGQSQGVAWMGGTSLHTAFNGLGTRMFWVDTEPLPTATHAAVYGNTGLLANDGDPSPVPGRNWAVLASPVLSLSETGHYLYTGTLEGDPATDFIVVVDGVLFRQEGDTLPAIAPFVLDSLGESRWELDDLGRVLWYGSWDDPDTTRDEGLFVGDELVVQEGVTTIGGRTVDLLYPGETSMDLAPGGRFLAFTARLDDGTEGAWLIDLPVTDTFCAAAPNSTGQPAAMGWSGSTSISHGNFALEAENVPPGHSGLFVQAPAPLDPPVPLGNGFLCLADGGLGFLMRLPPETSDAAGRLSHLIDFGAPPAPVGQILPGSTWYFTAWFRDLAAPPFFFNFANGLAVTFAP